MKKFDVHVVSGKVVFDVVGNILSLNSPYDRKRSVEKDTVAFYESRNNPGRGLVGACLSPDEALKLSKRLSDAAFAAEV